MNTLVQGYLTAQNDFQYNYHCKPVFPTENSHVYGYKLNPDLKEVNFLTNESNPVDKSSSEVEISQEFQIPTNRSTLVEEEGDHSDAILKFISQMLMEEEDLENMPCMLRDCLALQATEKSLFDVLKNNSSDENDECPNDHFTKSWNTCSAGSSSDGVDLDSLTAPLSDIIQLPIHTTQPNDIHSPLVYSFLNSPVWVSDPWRPAQIDFSQNNREKDIRFASRAKFLGHEVETNGNTGSDVREMIGRIERDHSPNSSREKKHRDREDVDLLEESRSNKQLANSVGEFEPLEMYDKVLLCPKSEDPCEEIEKCQHRWKPRVKEIPKVLGRGRPKGGKKGNIKEVVDLRSLLMQCAQALASYDSRSVNDLLMHIRQHSKPQGDGMERMAHYFANGLEARLAGTGAALYAGFASRRISAAQVLKAYQTFITSCPFKRMSNLFANRTIKKLASTTNTLHIIDFGIMYGFQWPCLIQGLSERPGGPPKLRITGIELPQPGFRPAQRVEGTGDRLRRYCERFGVPFEYEPIATKWETIKLEDLKIEKDEMLVVTSLNRLHNVPDETVMVNSPRDAVLDLIKKINPDMFIFGSINGTYNTPFFVTRFREAVFHFSSLFDMFEATIPREDENRMLFENEIFGKDIMNTIACEGTERVERPETYKQWQVRILRAGFRQLPLEQDIVKYVRRMVKMDYHRDFSVDEDGKWMLHGWKGRVCHAISCWMPVH